MSDNDIWKHNWEHVPWVTGDEGKNTKSPNSAEPKPAAERKKIEKPPAQAIVETVAIDVTQPLKEGESYSGSGKLKVFDGATLTDFRLSIRPLYRYKGPNEAKDKEDYHDQAIEVMIDKETLLFKFTIKKLFVPNAYCLDKTKPADAKYRLLIKVTGPRLDKDYFSKEVELPMAADAGEKNVDASRLVPITPEEGLQIVDCAKKWVGTPYTTGGERKTGADCSGSVWGIYNEAGFSFKRATAADFLSDKKHFKQVEVDNLQAGDVGCWYNPTVGGHVMIYDPSAGKTSKGLTANGWSASRPGGRPFNNACSSWYDEHYKCAAKWLRYLKQKP